MLSLLAVVAVAYTMEDFMGYTDRHQLTRDASIDTLVYWVEKKKGVANVFGSELMGGAWGQPQLMTQYTEDDGLEITIVAARQGIVYFNVGTMDGVNSIHDVTGTITPQSFTSAWNGGKVPQSTGSFALAVLFDPSTHTPMTYRAKSDGTSTTLTVGNQAAEKNLFKVTGSVSALAMSADGVIAFQNGRAEHGFIGVYVPGSKRVQYVAPSHDTDEAPLWVNNTLCWRRVRDMTGLDGRDTRCAQHGYCQGEPAFMMMAADFTLNADTKVMSFKNVRKLYENFVTGYPEAAGYGTKGMWGVGSEVVFGSEVEGHVKVMSVNVNTGVQRVLTPGACDNQAWMVAGTTLYTSNNCGLVDSMSIAAINVATAQATTLFQGEAHAYAGITSSGGGMAVTAGGLVYLHCTWNTSCVFRSDKQILSPDAFNGEVFGYVVPKLTTFKSQDGAFTLHAQVFEPKKPNGKGILFTHGGCHRQMYAAIHYARDYSSLYAQNQYLASLGFRVLSVNYRGGVGYGVPFRACKNCGWLGAAEYNDVMTGGLVLNEAFGTGNVFVHGLSYGGLNTMQAVTRNSDLFSAGVANAPVYNWVSILRYGAVQGSPFDIEPKLTLGYRTLRTGPYPDLAGPDWMGYTADNMKLAWESSPAGHMNTASSPLLLIQGDADANVDFAETLGAVRALRRAGYPESKLETLVFPDENHALSLFKNDVIAAEATVAFFLKHANLL